MAIVADGSAAWLHSFVVGHIEPGAQVITGAWRGHNGRQDLGYAHERSNQRAARAARERPAKVLSAVHRVASLARRWLLTEYLLHYNMARPHRSLGQLTPAQADSQPAEPVNLDDHRIRRKKIPWDSPTRTTSPPYHPALPQKTQVITRIIFPSPTKSER